MVTAKYKFLALRQQIKSLRMQLITNDSLRFFYRLHLSYYIYEYLLVVLACAFLRYIIILRYEAFIIHCNVAY